MRKVIANNAFEAIITHVSCHVNYINMEANVEERNDEPTLVTFTFVTNVGDGNHHHVSGHVKTINMRH